ncbi:MAG: prephenate/arogenate dehydrogenase family protein [Sphingomonadales bacterium]|jgi:cyclohexadieny/prephenate dehydrogenase
MTESSSPTIAIIGFGLIGSSLARAFRHHKIAGRIIAIDRDADTLETAKKLNLADEYSDDLSAVGSADIIILCSPVGTYEAIAKAIKPHIKIGAVVSDVGSVKGRVDQIFEKIFGDEVAFVPAHPVAGTEQSGPAAGFASLFHERWCILTPQPKTDKNAIKRIEDLWSNIGATVEHMDPKHHDLVLAITSHVPHLIAYNIVGTASDLEEVTRSEVIKYSAGGFRDFTRIAASDPTMWRDVFLNNKDAVLEMLGRFSEDLTALQRAIRWDDGDQLFNLFTRTRDIRRRIIDAGQDEATPDFGRHHEDD